MAWNDPKPNLNYADYFTPGTAPTWDEATSGTGVGQSKKNAAYENAMNAFNVQETNRANFAIAQMNNDYNYEMFMRQLDYDLDMWNRTNKYNSAASQRKRLEEAGLNPYLMMSGGNAGSATSMSSPTPAPAEKVNFQAPEMRGMASAAAADMNFLQTSVQQALGHLNGIFDTKIKAAEASVAQAKAIETLNGIRLANQNQRVRNDIDSLEYQFKWMTTPLNYRILQSSAEMSEKDAAIRNFDYLRAREEFKYMPLNVLMNASVNVSNAIQQYNRGLMSYNEVYKVYYDALTSYENYRGKKLDNDIIKKSFDDLVRANKIKGLPSNEFQAIGLGIDSLLNGGVPSSDTSVIQGVDLASPAIEDGSWSKMSDEEKQQYLKIRAYERYRKAGR